MTTKEMIDATGFKALVRHLENNPDINAIIQVFDPLELHVVGEAFKGELTDEIKSWFTSGGCAMYARNGGDGIKRNTAVPEVPLTQAVDCLYMPPYYIFKDKNKQWI